MTLDEARSFALSLPETTEQPHFEKSSFRVRGRIFATAAPDGAHLHLFLEDGEVRALVADHPAAFEELWWGRRLAGVRVNLDAAVKERVFDLLVEAWRRRAPRRVQESLDAR